MVSKGIAHQCPKCRKNMTVIERVAPQMFDVNGSRVSVVLAAWVYECSEHGRYVINVFGDIRELGIVEKR
jgi:hypothetical protein